jgi:transcriptional regulator with XRE-family HTH domain
MLTELGEALSSARERQGRSLQAVAEPAKISTAYLQKLERGQVSTPSPHVLRRLGTVLEVRYLRLMSLAGYLSDDEERRVATDDELRASRHPLADQQLVPEEWRAVGAFIKYLKAQRNRGARSGPG